MRERAQAIGKTVVADLNDPFNAVTLSADQIADDPARLMDEAQAQSMMGGARLIRITDGADKLAPYFKEYLQNPSDQNLIVIEAGELTPRSPLRVLFEKSDNAAALACYVEDEMALGQFIRSVLQDAGLNAQLDAVNWLSANLIGDRQRARRELEKLTLYKSGDLTPITLEEVMACCGAAGAQSLDDLVNAVAGKNAARALSVYNHLLDEGVAVIAVLRSLQNHFRRLHQTRCLMSAGAPMEDAMKKLSPPVFFKQEKSFKQQIQTWSLPALNKVLERLADLEYQSKQTGTPVETLCGQALLSLSASSRKAA